MKNNIPNIHEDLENLLIHKSFKELLPEEKKFIQDHNTSEEEYNRMRSLMYKLIEQGQDDPEWLDPDPDMKRVLLEQHFPEDKHSSPVWKLNWFWSISSLSVAALAIIGYLLYSPAINPIESNELLAENKFHQPQEDTSLLKNKIATPSNTLSDKSIQQSTPSKISYTPLVSVNEDENATENAEAVPSESLKEELQAPIYNTEEQAVYKPTSSWSVPQQIKKSDSQIESEDNTSTVRSTPTLTPESESSKNKETAQTKDKKSAKKTNAIPSSWEYKGGENLLRKNVAEWKNENSYKATLPSNFNVISQTLTFEFQLSTNGKIEKVNIVTNGNLPKSSIKWMEVEALKLGTFESSDSKLKKEISNQYVIQIQW